MLFFLYMMGTDMFGFMVECMWVFKKMYRITSSENKDTLLFPFLFVAPLSSSHVSLL